MTFGLSQVLYIIATILFLLSLFTQLPFHPYLLGTGLAFFAAGHAVGG